ncbi:hypothetical protein [Breoghania sp.]|uniref:hypothetical protein n=1 Tax=Breoghania sp. TaxID=2065378 RepID=UPI002AA70D55|nr:hypothetical protein [Breoghania sp.]
MQLLNQRILAGRWLHKHSTKLLLALTAALIVGSIFLTPTIQSYLEPRFLTAPEMLSALRSLLVGVGASLIGATAIIFSVVMLAVQLNFARIPFGLFRRLSSDVPLLASFAATFVLGVAIGICALLPDLTWVAPAVILSGWSTLAALALFYMAYKRALDLISPAKQLQIVFRKADRSMRRWERRANRFAPLLEERPAPGVDRDIARASYFRLHPHWEADVREASSHVIAFARRYAEQGEYDVSARALNGLIGLNGRYISARGDTFFGSSPFFTNPLSSEAFISDTLEKLRRLGLSAQGRSDEEQYIQVMTTLTSLCATYAHIDYGKKLRAELHHSQLAAAYLTGIVEGAHQTFGPDVMMEGVRLLGQCARVLVQARCALGSITIAKSVSKLSLLGLTKPGHEPVTSTAVQQLATLAFEMLKSEEDDIKHPCEEVRSSIRMIAHAVLLTDDRPFASQHSAHLKPYYALTDYGTFADNLTKLINAVVERPAGDNDAERIISHLSDWSDGTYRGEKKLLLDAVNKHSFLALDLINWICHVTEVLVVASTAPASSDHDRDELIRNATWLISVLDWLPDDKESVTFVENFQVVDQLFKLTLKMHVWDQQEIAEATRDILLRWSFKAGKHQTGWGSLERATTALCVLAAWKDGSGWVNWLKREFADRLTGTVFEEKIRKRTAQELRKNAKYPSHHRHVHDVVGYHMGRVDLGRFAEGMNAVADLLDQEAT